MRAHHHHWTPPVETGPDLFLPPPIRGVDTSLAAAAKIQPHTARVREGIYLWLAKQGAHGATEREISEALGLNSSTTRPRLRELEGNAPWAKGKLPARIQRTAEKRAGMRVYRVLA